jgi:hypothetical protein
MIIYANIRKSKVKLKPKQEREEYEAWLEKHKTPVVSKRKQFNLSSYKLSPAPGRETVRYPSLNTTGGTATKSAPKVYTGTKVMGIATMHKSNAVPVFNSEEAVEISKMRR